MEKVAGTSAHLKPIFELGALLSHLAFSCILEYPHAYKAQHLMFVPYITANFYFSLKSWNLINKLNKISYSPIDYFVGSRILAPN